MNVKTQGLSDFSDITMFLAVSDEVSLLETAVEFKISDLSDDHKKQIESILFEHFQKLPLSEKIRLLA